MVTVWGHIAVYSLRILGKKVQVFILLCCEEWGVDIFNFSDEILSSVWPGI